MIPVVLGAAVSLFTGLFGTPWFIKLLVKRRYGQFIRDDGPTGHHTKRGTPTMGGVIIIAGTVLAYLVVHVITLHPPFIRLRMPSASAALVIFLMVGLGFVGFLDDYIKISKQRSLGLRAGAKLAGQAFVSITFAVLALRFPSAHEHLTPASTYISIIRDTAVNLAFAGPVIGLVLFVVWSYLIIAAASNGVNLTDGLDGLASGASTMVAAAFVLIGIWENNNSCALKATEQCYNVRDPLDLAVFAACLMGATFGFLWWNASPAKIFMGDTGSLALGGAIAGLAVTTRTEMLLVILGGLFVIITMSVVIQIASFKLTGRRVFRMAPLQHHFELAGWGEVTIVIRFWIIAGLFVGLGLGVFYAEWVVSS